LDFVEGTFSVPHCLVSGSSLGVSSGLVFCSLPTTLSTFGKPCLCLLTFCLRDVFWYPFYEEVAYRGFALSYLVPKEMSVFSLRSLVGNLAQALLFVSIHHRYFTSGTPLFLVPVLLLGLANGFIFLKTRNIFGCFLCHSLANALALLIPVLT